MPAVCVTSLDKARFPGWWQNNAQMQRGVAVARPAGTDPFMHIHHKTPAQTTNSVGKWLVRHVSAGFSLHPTALPQLTDCTVQSLQLQAIHRNNDRACGST